MSVQDGLARWLKVYEDEVAAFFWSALLLCCIRSSNLIFANFAETAFLKRYGVEYLPIVTAINSVTTFVVMGALTPVLVRLPGSRILYRTLLVAGGTVGLLRLVLPLGIELLYPLLYVLKTQFDALLAFLFWNLANDLFSTRQSKRLFPLITAGGLLGAIIGSLGTPLLAKAISSNNLMFAYAVVAMAAAWVAQRIGTLFPSAVVAEKKKPGKGGLKSFGSSMVTEFKAAIPILQESTLAKVMLATALLPNIISPIIGYQYSFAIDQTFTSEGGMLGFFSYFRGAQNIIALFISLFVGRIYGRFGLPVALLFHPLNYGITFLAFLIWFNLYSAMYCGITTNVLRTTINGPANNALYGLFPTRHRAVIRPFLRGTVVRVGILLGSGAVLVSQALMHPRYLSLVALVCVGGWVAAVLVLKKRYTEILMKLLATDSLDVQGLEQADAAEIFRGTDLSEEVSECFTRASGASAVWHGQLLRSLDAADLDRLILDKLPGEDDATRLELLPLLSDRAGEPALQAFLQLADADKPELMLALARTAKRVYADMPLETRREIFEKTRHPEVKACFLPGLLDGAPEEYLPVLEGWFASGEPAERRAAAMGAGESGRREYLERLAGLLEVEQDDSVIPAILRGLDALGDEGINERARPLLAHGSEAVRAAAVEVSKLDSEGTVRQVALLLGDPVDLVRAGAIRKLEATEFAVAPILVEALATGGRRTREAVFLLAESLDIKEMEVYRFCTAALERAYRDLATIDAVGRWPEGVERDLLMEHLDQRRELRVENVLRGLAANDRSGRLRTVWHGLSSLDSRQRSNSLEALDNLLENSLRDMLLPLLENVPLPERLAFGHKRFGIEPDGDQPALVFSRLLASDDRVAVMLTLHLATKMGDAEIDSSALDRLVQSTDRNVRVAAQRLAMSKAEHRGEKEEAVGETLGIPEKILQLKSIDILEGLSVGELAVVAQISKEGECSLGDVLGRQGEPCERILLLLSGEVSVSRTAEGRAAKELGRLGSGESLGALNMVADSPLQVTVRAEAPCRFLEIGKAAFREVLRDYPEVAIDMCKVMGNRMLALIEKSESQERGEP